MKEQNINQINQIKAEVFDLIIQQEHLQNQINHLQQIKMQKIEELNKLEQPDAK